MYKSKSQKDLVKQLLTYFLLISLLFSLNFPAKLASQAEIEQCCTPADAESYWRAQTAKKLVVITLIGLGAGIGYLATRRCHHRHGSSSSYSSYSNDRSNHSNDSHHTHHSNKMSVHNYDKIEIGRSSFFSGSWPSSESSERPTIAGFPEIDPRQDAPIRRLRSQGPIAKQTAFKKGAAPSASNSPFMRQPTPFRDIFIQFPIYLKQVMEALQLLCRRRMERHVCLEPFPSPAVQDHTSLSALLTNRVPMLLEFAWMREVLFFTKLKPASLTFRSMG